MLSSQEVVDSSPGTLPCSIYTFGYGTAHNSSLLEGLADLGSGLYFFIQNADDISLSFVECLGGLLTVVAQDLKLSFKPLSDCTIQKILYKSSALDGGSTVLLGDIQSEEQRDILVSLSLPALPVPTESQDILEVTLTSYNVLRGRQETFSTTASIIRGEEEAEGQDEKVAKGKLRIVAVEAMEASTAFSEKGDFDQAQVILENQIKTLQDFPYQDETTQALLSDLKDCQQIAKSAKEFREGAHKMRGMKMEHERQRNARPQGRGGAYNTRGRGKARGRG
eukprot:CAMPEP_0174268212 /NCGR_PEP_ID=MMETSP0439-20130205/36600_1 /TAXON_ID=0 /ORGANISM="Stereomyxa ramosa, Strain Chinc5" /LENGTH=279 /DNA_ID=CAMNT_0015356243 /DNA_START=160 /DNA_END=995 /DNA_ORIENTATION=-